MPINVYTGLMRSGKSYEVVSEVILTAIASGRRVVTNVDGISNDLIREYVSEKNNIAPEKLGVVVHVTNADVFREDFFPHYDDGKAAHTDTIVQPGDLVCIDEAWRFWGTDSKLLKQHKSFFLEHGHFTHPSSGVACDLVLMIQDMGTLHRFVKNVVAFNFRTHKKVSLGMDNTYSVTCWEGYKQTKQVRIGEWVRRYRKEIFPLYSSFKGGAEGKTVNVDNRQNIFANKKLWFGLAVAVIFGIFSAWQVFCFFKPADANSTISTPKATSTATTPAQTPTVAPTKPPTKSFSEVWRASGSIYVNGQAFVLVTNQEGSVRFESPSMFQHTGLIQVGRVDGDRVTSWSGKAIAARSAPVPPALSTGSLSSTTPTKKEIVK
ncbi:MAG: zonula occludens toxin [Oxalobacter sp.]|nr:MAG: zonula occludens toxin [Oxalobacter sp.]